MAKAKQQVSHFRQGFDAFLAGKNLVECPYPFDSIEAKDWRDGWRAGERMKGGKQ